MLKKRIEIKLSKKKMIMLNLAALGFVCLGLVFILTPEKFSSTHLRNPALIKVIGIGGVLFFGAAGIYGVRKLFNQAPGLVIDETGITDHTHAYSVGLIEWKDITNIERISISGSVFFVIQVNNHDKYLQQCKGLRRKVLEFNRDKYGSPLTISATALQLSANELERLLVQRLEENKNITTH